MLCGIDEAGRGPLAGPVTAAAVILGDGEAATALRTGGGLKDSKLLSASRREELSILIRHAAWAWAVGWAWPWEIDRLNIHHASLLAMRRAFWGMLARRVENRAKGIRVEVDGRFFPRLPVPCAAVVHGDSSVPEIAAASILAKVTRDRWMCAFASHESRFDFCGHKGYPTPRHRNLIEVHGTCLIHRRSFRMLHVG